MKMLIIADDMTGALDCGVQLSGQGISVYVSVGDNQRHSVRGPQVVVVDTESRHMTPKDAYQTVYHLVREAKQRGVPCIYKKTDSGLRGNIGAELSAAVEAAGQTLYFVPAFPQLDRVTVNGHHYWAQTPIHETVFGEDPFEPVTSSYIPHIIAQQSSLPCMLYRQWENSSGTLPHIAVMDAQSDEDMLRAGETLKRRGNLSLLAGCAGFANCLPDLLDLPREELVFEVEKENLLVVSASLNQVTIDQMNRARLAGYPVVTLTPEEKLFEGWSGREKTARHITETYRTNKVVLVESVRSRDEMLEEVQVNTCRKDLRSRIGKNIALLTRRCLEQGFDGTLAVFGGDLLMELLRELNCTGIDPLEEIVSGVVLSTAYTSMGKLNMVTKSGGFGDVNIVPTIHSYLKQKSREKETGAASNKGGETVQ